MKLIVRYWDIKMNSDRITPDTSCSISAKLAGIDVQKT